MVFSYNSTHWWLISDEINVAKKPALMLGLDDVVKVYIVDKLTNDKESNPYNIQ